MDINRTTDARPGSAWDDWHKAGFEYAQNGGDQGELEDAASLYSDEKPFRIETVRRAFIEGARNYWAQSNSAAM